MRTSKHDTRMRILDAAYGLFWRQGFLRVSMDEIAARAKLTKRTLYQHFTSKDDIIAAAIAHSSDLALTRLSRFPRAPTAEGFIDAYFEHLSAWAATPKWSGGGFTRVVVELADLRGHPARRIARRHKSAVETWLGESLAATGCAKSEQRAREIMLLMEGAMALMLIHGDRGYARAAAVAAKELVR